MKKHKVVLYNPECVFYTMPLALLAVGSRLDPAKYDVRIVDGRLEQDRTSAVLAELDGALCLGVTVLTGAPILDALAITRAAKDGHPDLPVIWGGWHASLFPDETLAEAGIDALVTGQGEDTFAEIVERLADGGGLAGIAGCRVADAPPGAPRVLRDINAFPAHDYGLIPVERYFARKGWRQVDYISSQGCRFRCTFCADPFVYKRGWFGLEPGRMGDELERLWRRHAVEDVNFQDETFFTHRGRVAAIAEEFLRRGTTFTWTATMRADQGSRLDAAALGLCRRSGLRRVMIGIESGSPEMLESIRKDITLDQVFDSAEKCLRHGIGALFNLIIGFPDETAASVAATLAVAKRLRAMSATFEVAIFYYKPYPGNPIADALAREGYRFPRSLREWAAFDYVGSPPGPWITPEQHRRVERFKFYQHIAWSRATPLRAPVQALARWRCRRDYYGLPVEKTVIEWLRPPVRLS
jgi:anaerobic magnesium-protoporphyrin IX monomethyl ester cyclase